MKNKKVFLNNDLLNDTGSVYFQINRLDFIKYSVEETDNFLEFFSNCYNDLKNHFIQHRALFIPLNIYNNIICLIRDNSLYPITATLESVLYTIGITENNITVYIPDIMNDANTNNP